MCISDHAEVTVFHRTLSNIHNHPATMPSTPHNIQSPVTFSGHWARPNPLLHHLQDCVSYEGEVQFLHLRRPRRTSPPTGLGPWKHHSLRQGSVCFLWVGLANQYFCMFCVCLLCFEYLLSFIYKLKKSGKYKNLAIKLTAQLLSIIMTF